MSTTTTAMLAAPEPEEPNQGARVLPLHRPGGGRRPGSTPGESSAGAGTGGERGHPSRVDPDPGLNPVVTPDAALALDDAIEGELLSEAESRARGRWLAEDRPRVVQVTTRVVVIVWVAVRHERTTTTVRAVTRHAVAYPVAGLVVAVRRWRDAHGAGRYERQMRAAETAGDQDALRYWQEADVAEKQRRHDRVMDWLTVPARLLRAVLLTGAGSAGLLLVFGVLLALHSGQAGDVLTPIAAVIGAAAFVVWFLTAYGVLLLCAGTAGALAYLYHLGRTRAELPAWLTAPADLDTDTMDELPDESTIVKALANCNIPGFTKALKGGWRIRFRMPPTLDGKGWRCQIDLPPAAPVVEFVRRKPVLAHNLLRYPIEVWPTEPSAGVLDLWVANPGALSGPVDPWPLLEDLDHAQTDYFAGVPVAVTIRGDVVRGRLSEANYAVGGQMGSGKSTLVITLLHGAMLDPLVDIDVVVMAENADYEPMKPRLRSLVTGAGPDTVDACMALLTSLYEDLSVRGQALREHDERAVTRPLAERDPRLRPRIVVIDECQNLFMGGDHGKTAIETAAKLISTARKYAITLMFLTPEPSKDALPRKIISITSNKACFAIGDQIANDAVLSTGSYKAGISAVGLTPKTDDGPGDVGTFMQRGFTPKPGLLRSFYIPQRDAHRVTQRALQLRQQHGVPTEAPTDPGPARDPLADIVTVLGDAPRMKTMDVLQRLTELHRPTYQVWTARTLTACLTDHRAAPYKTEGSMQVSAARIHDALTARDAATAQGAD